MERKYIATKNFSVPESGGYIRDIPQGAIITLESEDSVTKMTVNIPDSVCVYSFYISSAIINPFLPFCVKDYDGKSKGPEELKEEYTKEPESKDPDKPSTKERKYVVIKNFCVPDADGNERVVLQDTVITLEPVEQDEDIITKMTVNALDSMCVYSFYISTARLNRLLPFCVKDYDGKSKDLEELKAMEHKEPKPESPGKLPANRHLQVKICKTEDEANRFMANRPDADIVSVTPVAMGTNYYADIFFQVVYRTNL